jgi:hypothetical protein
LRRGPRCNAGSWVRQCWAVFIGSVIACYGGTAVKIIDETCASVTREVNASEIKTWSWDEWQAGALSAVSMNPYFEIMLDWSFGIHKEFYNGLEICLAPNGLWRLSTFWLIDGWQVISMQTTTQAAAPLSSDTRSPHITSKDI